MGGLSGARILVTRPVHQSENLCRLIEKQGGAAIRLPTIEIVACNDLPRKITALKSPEQFQWLVFISANAVNFALPAISGKIERFTNARIAAIGRATAKALESAGLSVDLLPEQGFDSEALLAMPQMHAVSGQRFLIVRGIGGREELANTLRGRGAEVGYLEVYRRIIPSIDCSPVINLLTRNRLDVITVTSAEALQNLLMMLGEKYHKPLTVLPLVAVSDRIARIASECGFKRIFVADSPTDTSILETVTMCTTGEQSGRSK
jgi:uroporphyrinogen-III synthase